MVTPHTLRGGILLLDPVTGAVQKVIALQFNPGAVTRTLEVQASTEKKGEPLRLKGVAVETLKVEAELDGSDVLTGQGDTDSNVSIHPQLAALEGLVQPRYATLVSNDRLANLGVLEILPAEAPLAVFVWGRKRVVPVRV